VSGFLARFTAVFVKEFIQMRRDRLTFAMMVGVPLMQLTLFGFAINADPKNMPTAVVLADEGPYVRSIVRAIRNTDRFQITRMAASEAEALQMLQQGQVQFIVTVPPHFERDLLRGQRPTVLVEADASDPAAVSYAFGALGALNTTALQHDLIGPLAGLNGGAPAFDLTVQRRYNPEGISQYNIVPGLMGVVLTMTMVAMTSMAMTRERERGTLENLLAMPVRPLEVMLGKVLPFIVVGYIQVAIILTAARFMFQVPVQGSIALLSAVAVLFIAANLCVGFTFSTLAESQMQAMQMSMFFFLPSLLLSGFMFPFTGMPKWAQYIAEGLPLTHFLRIVRGILLKGNDWAEIWPNVWPIGLFLLAVALLALRRYRQTLD
jgi:ABC-2 type transport system permease protein